MSYLSVYGSVVAQLYLCTLCVFLTVLSSVPVISLLLVSNIILILFKYCPPRVCYHGPHGEVSYVHCYYVSIRST